jgi:pimeloyl-ACP methyl ester carboxylesterase
MSAAAGSPLPGTPEPMQRWPAAEGLALAADAWGDPGAPLVLLLHGGGQTRHAWRATAQRLAAEGYHAVALDSRGHGDADWSPDGHYDRDHFVADLHQVVDAFGGARPVLVGASHGGITALVAAGEGHVDAAALVLVDVVPRTERAGFDRVRGFMGRWRDGFGSLDEVADAVASYHPDGRRPSNPQSLAKNVRRNADGRLHWHWDPRFLPASEREFPTRPARLAACAKQLRVPTLLVRGGSSDVVSEDGAREFLALCPHSEYVNVADAGHMISGDSNEAFGRAMEDFLRRHIAPRPPSGDLA